MSIGFIGFGEAAFHITSGLKEAGFPEIQAYDKFWDDPSRGELVRKRAAETQTSLCTSLQDLVERNSLIFSAVSADMAVPLAREAKPFLQSDKVYVDMNATSPMTKEAVAEIIADHAQFVDCAIMGPVPTYKHKVPMLVSGTGAPRFFQELLPYGMNVKVMAAPAGSASASKMFRSIFMKGFVMLVLEMLLAARRYQIEDDVLQSVEKTLTNAPFLEVINGLVSRGVIHSERREHEMEEVISTLEALQIDGIMSRATKEKLHWCTGLGLKEHFKGVPPDDFHAIFSALEQKRE